MLCFKIVCYIKKIIQIFVMNIPFILSLEGGPLMWMMPLHVNRKPDNDDLNSLRSCVLHVYRMSTTQCQMSEPKYLVLAWCC